MASKVKFGWMLSLVIFFLDDKKFGFRHNIFDVKPWADINKQITHPRRVCRRREKEDMAEDNSSVNVNYDGGERIEFHKKNDW